MQKGAHSPFTLFMMNFIRRMKNMSNTHRRRMNEPVAMQSVTDQMTPHQVMYNVTMNKLHEMEETNARQHRLVTATYMEELSPISPVTGRPYDPPSNSGSAQVFLRDPLNGWSADVYIEAMRDIDNVLVWGYNHNRQPSSVEDLMKAKIWAEDYINSLTPDEELPEF